MSKQNHQQLAGRLSKLIEGKTIHKVMVLNETELVLFLENGTRLFVSSEMSLDISVT